MTSRIAPLSILALAAFAAATVAGVTIHRTPKVGEVNKYRMKADLTIMGQPATFTGLLQEKVTKVESDGTFTSEESQLEGKVSLGGNDMDIPSSGSVTTSVHNPDGILKQIVGDSASADAYRMATLNTFAEPGKEVNVGDSWSHEFQSDTKTGLVAAKADYKYLGDEKVGDVDCYKVEAKVAETEGSTPASSDSVLWIDKATGVMIKMEGKWVNAPFPGAPEPINATITLTREV